MNKLPQGGFPCKNDRGSCCSFLEKNLWFCTAYDTGTKQLAELLQSFKAINLKNEWNCRTIW